MNESISSDLESIRGDGTAARVVAELMSRGLDGVAAAGASTAVRKMKDSDPAQLQSLPSEQLPNVFSHLELRDVLRVRLVNRRFRDVTFDNCHHLWMEHESTSETNDGRPNNLSPRNMMLLLRNFPRARSLRLTGLLASDPRQVCGVLQNEASALTHLELLGVSEGFTHAEPNNATMHTDISLKKLKRLTIEGSFAHPDNPLFQSLVRSSRDITHLGLIGWSRLDDDFVEGALSTLLSTTLVHLDLSCSGSLRRPTIHSTTLKTIVLQGCQLLHSVDIDCPLLDTLDVSSCPRFVADGLLDEETGLADSLPLLRVLKMRNCTSLIYVRIKFPMAREWGACEDDEHKKPCSSTQPSELPLMLPPGLEDIDLSMCVKLASVVISCPLKAINLEDCHHLKVVAIESRNLGTLNLSKLPLELASLSCPSLLRLNLSGCANLDSKRSIMKCEELQTVDIRGATLMTPEFFCDRDRNNSLVIQSGQVEVTEYSR